MGVRDTCAGAERERERSNEDLENGFQPSAYTFPPSLVWMCRDGAVHKGDFNWTWPAEMVYGNNKEVE